MAPWATGPNERGASRGHIMDSVEASLKRLQTDHIDLYQIHGTDTGDADRRDAARARRSRLARHGALCRRLELAGVADRQGARHFRTPRLCPLRDGQSYYSIAGRDLEREIVPLLERGEARPDGLVAAGRRPAVWQIRPGAPGNGEGRRASFNFPPVDKDRAWAAWPPCARSPRSTAVSVATVALAYVLAKPFVTSVIIGAKPHRAARSEPCRRQAEARRRRHARSSTRSARCRPNIRAGCSSVRRPAAIRHPSCRRT